jgi:hypothetical protein
VAAQLGHSVEMLSRHYAGVLEQMEAEPGRQRDAAEAIEAARAEVARVRLLFVRDAGGEA